MQSEDDNPKVQLPVEVWQVIVESTPIASQLALYQVSTRFRSLTSRSLYYKVCLNKPSSVVSFCQALLSNATAAESLHHFDITYSYQGLDYLPAFYNLLGTALSRTKELVELKIMVTDASYISAIEHITFPHLRHFQCHLYLTEPLVRFLNRHPGLLYLQITPMEHYLTMSPSVASLPRIVLPKLEYFAGNSECFPVLGPEASLRAAFVCYDSADGDTEEAINAIADKSGDTLRLLSCRRRGWNIDLFNSISLRLPYISALVLTNVMADDERASQETLDMIKHCLPRFKNLMRLSINCLDIWQMSQLECDLNEDFNTVISCGAACPTLRDISLPHSKELSWFRVADDMWIPDPRNTEASQWLYTMVRAKRYRGWGAKVVDTIEDRFYNPSGSTREDTDAIAAVQSFFTPPLTYDEEEEGELVDLPHSEGEDDDNVLTSPSESEGELSDQQQNVEEDDDNVLSSLSEREGEFGDQLQSEEEDYHAVIIPPSESTTPIFDLQQPYNEPEGLTGSHTSPQLFFLFAFSCSILFVVYYLI